MRRGILKLGVGWVLCAAAWAACGGEKTITRKDLGFEITVPIKASSDYDSISWTRKKENSSLVVYNLKESDGLSSFFRIPLVRTELKDTTVMDICIVRLEGRSAIKLTVQWSIFRRTFYYTVGHARGYLIQMATDRDDFDSDSREFDAIVESFKIIDSK